MVWAYAARSRNTIRSNPIFSAIAVVGTFVVLLALFIRRRMRGKDFSSGRYFDLNGHGGGASLLGDNKGD